MNIRTVGAFAEVAVRTGLTAWFTVTALSQHPNRQYDRFRKFDRSGVAIPNWRFFAPEPCTHDFRVLHRTLSEDGAQSHWQETHSIQSRRFTHMFWFPERRRDKGMNDICNEMVTLLHMPDLDIAATAPYRVLRDQVAQRVAEDGKRVQGFQFLLLADAGYDEDEETQYIFASKFEPVVSHA